MAFLSHVYTVAKKDWLWSYIDENPVENIRKPTVKNDRNRRIFERIYIYGASDTDAPPSEINWIIKETKSNVLPTIITLALETAMRRSEIINIQREHIDFESGTLYIPDSKNGMPRHVPLSPLARYTLITYLTKYNPINKVFNISSSSVTQSFLRACRNARKRYERTCINLNQTPNPHYLVDLRFHDLRHEATSRLATVYEMHELAKVTGHKDTRMLLRYYHPDAGKLAQKLAQSAHGQAQFHLINKLLLESI